jgi:hypothetical protein
MRKFNIIGLLEATQCFSKEEGANDFFENAVRESESSKQAITPEEIQVVSEDTITQVFSTIVPAHCLGKMVSCVINKYAELGHETTT